jgi:hypothetical protein
MAVTSAYAVWADWLERFGCGEVDELGGLPEMRGEELGAAAAQRFAARCASALDRRLARWSRSLERDIRAARRPDQLSLALVNARSRLGPVRRFTESPLIFVALREGLVASLRTTVVSLHEDLQGQAARADLGVREAMIRAVADVPLTRALEGPAGDAVRLDPTSGDAVPAGGRRILLAPRGGSGG